MTQISKIIGSLVFFRITPRGVMFGLLGIGWFLVILLSLLCGCTEGDITGVVTDASRPVTLRFSHPGLGQPENPTRADNVSEQLPTGATVRIAAYYRKATDGNVDFATMEPTYQATYQVKHDGSLSPCIVDDNGKMTDANGSDLTVRGGTYDFYAVSPARKLQLSTDGGNVFQINDIKHKEDVMTSYKRGVLVSQTSNTVSLQTFTRKCALVVFNVEPDAGNAVDIVTLKGKSLTMKGISISPAFLKVGETQNITATRGEISASNAQINFIDTDFEPVSPLPSGSPQYLNKTKGAILPKQAGPFEVDITVERDGQTANLTATIDELSQTAFEPGKRYVFTLKIKNNKGCLFLRVLDWNTHEVTDGSVGTPGPDTPVDPDITPGVGIPMQVAEWNNITWTGNGNAGNTTLITINQRVADAFKTKADKGPSNKIYPPFNYDGGVATLIPGEDHKGDSESCTVEAPYPLEVETTQFGNYSSYAVAIQYCKDRGPGWRLPTLIELFAIWDKAKGNDDDASDLDEVDSKIFDALFFPDRYWSSSVNPNYGRNTPSRCRLNFKTGNFFDDCPVTGNAYYRCVRDINKQ